MLHWGLLLCSLPALVEQGEEWGCPWALRVGGFISPCPAADLCWLWVGSAAPGLWMSPGLPFRAGARVSGLCSAPPGWCCWQSKALLHPSDYNSAFICKAQSIIYFSVLNEFNAMEASKRKTFVWYCYALWILNEVTSSRFWWWVFLAFILGSVLEQCPPTQLCWGRQSRIKFMFLYFQSSSLPRTELSVGFVGLRSLHLVKFLCLTSVYALIIIPASSLGLQPM